MRKRVAVETQLSGVRHALEERGYEVVQLDPLSRTSAELHGLQAVVISGQDENMLGREDLQTQASVIDARGMTTEEVVAAASSIRAGNPASFSFTRFIHKPQSKPVTSISAWRRSSSRRKSLITRTFGSTSIHFFYFASPGKKYPALQVPEHH